MKTRPTPFLALLVALSLGLLLIGCGGGAETEAPAPAAEDLAASTSPSLPSWVTMGDAEFCETYYDDAVSPDQDARSRFAWMLFARMSQMQEEPGVGGPQTFTTWELWPSDITLFQDPPGKPPTERKGPAISVSTKQQINQAASEDGAASEERTRNALAYDYIVKRNLYTRAGAKAALAEGNPNDSPRIDFPVGSIETKVAWATAESWKALTGQDQLPDDMYQISTVDQGEKKVWGLQGFHIMAKIKAYPDGPRPIEAPSWFWTTVEYYDNPNRKYLLDYVTYKDTLSYEEQKAILDEAGLGGTIFAREAEIPIFDSQSGEITKVQGNNYSINGTQYRFTGPPPGTTAADASGSDNINVILGNSVLELAFAVDAPPGLASPFGGWNSSCHTCHFEAAGNGEHIETNFHALTGDVTIGNDPNGQQMYPIDFEWSIPLLSVPTE